MPEPAAIVRRNGARRSAARDRELTTLEGLEFLDINSGAERRGARVRTKIILYVIVSLLPVFFVLSAIYLPRKFWEVQLAEARESASTVAAILVRHPTPGEVDDAFAASLGQLLYLGVLDSAGHVVSQRSEHDRVVPPPEVRRAASLAVTAWSAARTACCGSCGRLGENQRVVLRMVARPRQRCLVRDAGGFWRGDLRGGGGRINACLHPLALGDAAARIGHRVAGSAHAAVAVGSEHPRGRADPGRDRRPGGEREPVHRGTGSPGGVITGGGGAGGAPHRRVECLH